MLDDKQNNKWHLVLIMSVWVQEELLRRAEEEEGEGDDRKPTPIEQRIAQVSSSTPLSVH